MTSQRAELVVGFLSGALGIIGLNIVLFGPVYPYTAYMNSGIVHGSEGYLVTPHGFLLLPPPSDVVVPIAVSLVLPLLILIGALLHSRQRGSLVGLILLVDATVALLIDIVFNPIALLRLFLLPSLFLALITCALAFRRGQQSGVVAAGQAHS
ncbi:MAG TPA: hypothetical protein VH591_07055 [Ktedonobacterales bacterium]|jgi:hypothetical protein